MPILPEPPQSLEFHPPSKSGISELSKPRSCCCTGIGHVDIPSETVLRCFFPKDVELMDVLEWENMISCPSYCNYLTDLLHSGNVPLKPIIQGIQFIVVRVATYLHHLSAHRLHLTPLEVLRWLKDQNIWKSFWQISLPNTKRIFHILRQGLLLQSLRVPELLCRTDWPWTQRPAFF